MVLLLVLVEDVKMVIIYKVHHIQLLDIVYKKVMLIVILLIV